MSEEINSSDLPIQFELEFEMEFKWKTVIEEQDFLPVRIFPAKAFSSAISDPALKLQKAR